MFLDYYILGIVVLPGILLSIYAQYKVHNTFNKYNTTQTQTGKTASQIARMFLDLAGLKDIAIVRTRGTLTDYYDHRNKTLALSDSVHDSTSVSAIGVACHEVGHALQYKSNYFPIKIRSIIVPIAQFANQMLWVLIFMGAFFYYTSFSYTFLLIGVAVFGVSILLSLITLPIEFNASRRALGLMRDSSVLYQEEVEQAREVLNSASFTYVAGLIVSILNLLRLLLVFARRRSD